MNVLYPEMIYPEIMTYPSITDGAIDFLNKNILNKNLIGLEFGIGTSTIYMAKKFKKFVGIEHNGIYFYNIVTQLSPYDKEKITLILHHSEIDEKTDKLIDSYADELDQFEDEYFDFILVDGRNRIECFKKCDRVLKKGGYIMLDDSQRDKYQEIFDFYKDKEYFEFVQNTKSKYNPQLGEVVWKTSWWKK